MADENEPLPREIFRKRIWYIDPKDGKQKQKMQTWSVSPDGDEDEWDIDDGIELPEASDGWTDKVPNLTSKKLGRPKGSKNRRGTRVARKTREPTAKKKL